MSTPVRISNEAANDVVTTYEADFKGDPTEAMECADFITKLPVDGKFGQTIKVRIVPAMTSQAAATSLSLVRSSLTSNNNTDRVVSATNQFVYGVVAVNQSTWNAVRDNAQMAAQYKTMLRQSMEEKIESDVFANAPNLSNQIVQADIDDPGWRAGYGRIRKTAKRKAKLGEADLRLYVPADEVANAMGINAIKEYQIRGSAGAAVTGSPVNAYGIKWDASTLIYTSGGSAYAPLILKDAWFIAFNQTPAAIDDQTDGFTDWFLFRADYATTELFDSSGVVFVLTVP